MSTQNLRHPDSHRLYCQVIKPRPVNNGRGLLSLSFIDSDLKFISNSSYDLDISLFKHNNSCDIHPVNMKFENNHIKIDKSGAYSIQLLISMLNELKNDFFVIVQFININDNSIYYKRKFNVGRDESNQIDASFFVYLSSDHIYKIQIISSVDTVIKILGSDGSSRLSVCGICELN
jgi:hypothetical protein